LVNELTRLRLLRRLDERWEHTVTVVSAGPGFGKTTLLAQAVRAHQLEPRGLDVWVSCSAEHERSERLALAILQAISPGRPAPKQPGGQFPGARDVLAELVAQAPMEVCLILDDVHEIPAGSPGADLLATVLRTLPTTVHLLLSGRGTPDLPMARLAAAGEVLRVGAEELAFTAVEVGSLARRLGSTSRLAETLHGWPALVRLAFAAGPAAPAQYAREEILSHLRSPQTLALASLATLGTATAGEVEAVAGVPADLADLAERIPLVSVMDDGQFRAHELWADAVCRMLTAQQQRATRQRAIRVLAARGDLTRAGALACQAQDWELLAELSVMLVRSTLSTLPTGVARRWLAAIPSSAHDEPAFLLLAAAAAHADNYADEGVDATLNRAWLGMRGRQDQRGAAAVLGQAVIAAHTRADIPRLVEIARWANTLPDLTADPLVSVLRHSVASVLAEVSGDPETALDHLTIAPVTDVPRPLALFTLRFQFHCLNMVGRGLEAADLADRCLANACDPRVSLSGPIARWFAGDPSQLTRLRELGSEIVNQPTIRQPTTDQHAGSGQPPTTARDAFVAGAMGAVVAASCGETSHLPARPCGTAPDHPNARDAVLACAAEAAVAVARGNDNAGARAYDELLRTWPPTDRFTERHLRRFLTLGYVLCPRLQTHWDTIDLGPAHTLARAAGRALIAARIGDLSLAAGLPTEHALSFLPLPWSVELSARLESTGRHRGLPLGRWLADTIGPAFHRQLSAAVHSDDRAVAGGATALTATLPAPPTHTLGIAVLGPLRLTRDGLDVAAPELRRARVRQLLGALVLYRSLSRDRVMDMLWPGLDRTSAARNLRVTLTHLRHLLEPDRAGGASYHLQTVGEELRLVSASALTVDLWTFGQLEAEVRQARLRGDIDRAAELLRTAVELFRGDPLPDLEFVNDPDIAGRISQVRTSYLEQLLDLGELSMVSGDAAPALTLGERVLSIEPFDSRGHRLVLAAALRGRNPVQMTRARQLVRSALTELGAPPDRATSILLQQLSTLLGARDRLGFGAGPTGMARRRTG
jgi:DNA-binding SARP family transcriptional activator